LALLSLAGLPPGVLGLVAKVAALRPVVTSELWLLAVVAAFNAVLGVAVYLRWLLLIVSPAEAPVAGSAAKMSAGPEGSLLPDGTVLPGGTLLTAQAVRVHPAILVAVGSAAVALVATSLSPQLLVGLLGS